MAKSPSHFPIYGHMAAYVEGIAQFSSSAGKWNSKDGVIMKTETDMNATQGNFDLNRVRIVSSILDPQSLSRWLALLPCPLPPFMMEKKDAHGNEIKGEYEGFCVDLVEKLSQMIKFKYKVKAVSDGQFGIIVNGSWNGMIGELLRRVFSIPETAARFMDVVEALFCRLPSQLPSNHGACAHYRIYDYLKLHQAPLHRPRPSWAASLPLTNPMSFLKAH
ncbi:hypothetical protein ACTXT7_005397 [Hymenolepis weldensis]